MPEKRLKASLASGEHARLGQLVGEWEGTTRTWFEPGVLGDESTWRGIIRPLFDGRFVVHEYAGTLCGEELHGLCIMGYDLTSRKWQSAWVDVHHMFTGIMFSEGDPGDHGFAVTGSYPLADGSPRWGWRTEVEQNDPDHLVIRAYNISPAGEEALGVETRYTRVRRPCL